MMRSPSFVQQRPQLRRDSSQYDHWHEEERRPRSSDAKSDSHYSAIDNRARSNYSAEPGEITVRSERESQSARASMDRDTRPTNYSRDSYRGGAGPSPTMENAPRFAYGADEHMREPKEPPKEAQKRRRKRPAVRVVRFNLPAKPVPPEQNSESDDDEDMADYFAMEIEKTETELSKLEKPKLPTQIMTRFAALSHGSMVKIVNEDEALMKIVEELPKAVNQPIVEKVKESTPVEQNPEKDVEMTDVADAVKEVTEPPQLPEEPPKPEQEPEPPADVEEPEKPIVETAADPALEQVSESAPEPAPEPTATEPKPVEEETVKEPVKEPVQEPVQEDARESVEETVQEVIQEPVQARIEEPAAPGPEPEPEPKTEEMDIDKPTTEIPPVAPEATMDVVEEPTKEDAVPNLVEAPSIEAEKQNDTALEKPNEVITEKPSESKPNETPAEKIIEVPPENIQTNPDEASKVVPEKPGETGPDRPEETPTERPVPEVAPVTVIAPNVVLQTTEEGSKPPSTPSQVDDDETESEDDSFMNIDTVRQYMTTPPIDSLPDFGCKTWDKDKDYLRTLDSDSIMDDFVIEHLDKMHLEKTAAQDHERKVYAEHYVHYLEFTTSNDPAAVKSRGKFSVSSGTDGASTVVPEPKHEGSGRGRRFATERDLERVLQASMREDEERKERELRMQQEKYRTDKEAIIPDMIWTQEEKDHVNYIDQSGFTPVNRLVSAWRVLPPVNNFTEEETALFENRYLEAPKQWGKVAEAIPHRDFGTCIQYYYMNKKELNLKEKLKKQPKKPREWRR
ncbi:hypothetical protein NM208_g16290 [Fusarium decemcellulare]|uniref:Uncharacterized protein n=1 Tax=Fusarium decemcellulare TaxID=57161 RepID=A0ACC1RE27_9HYPO|nr:hypothetical protein NM208_g16290 [Fusarium decemcellulare]